MSNKRINKSLYIKY